MDASRRAHERTPDARSASSAAYAVRQIEIGLASIAGAFFGIALVLHGVALAASATGTRGLSIFGILAGAAVVAGSTVQAHVGFSDAAMALTMPGSAAALVWCACAGLHLIRIDRETKP